MSEPTTLTPVLRSMYPSIVQVAKMYNDAYPHESTAPEVLDAVTVAVPLRTYMVMSALVAQTLAAVAATEPHTEAGAD